MTLNAELLDRLSQLGGTALFVVTVVTIAIGLKRRWWVPGWVYEAERERRVRAEQAVERLTKALAAAAARQRRALSTRSDDAPHRG